MSEGGSSLGVLVVIGVVLLLIVGVANVAHAADRTVLDDETVIDTMDDEGVFASLSQELQEEITQDAQRAIENEQVEPIVFEQYVQDLDTTVTVQIDGLNDAYADIIQNELNIEALAQEAFSEAYIRGEATRNIQQIYAYLEGDTDSLDIAVDLSAPRETFIEAIETLRTDIEQNPQLIRDSIDDETLDRLIDEEIDRLVTEELDEEIRQAAARPGSPSEEEIEQQVRQELRFEIDNRIDDELQSPEVQQTVDSALADAEQELRNEFSEEEEISEDELETEELDDAREALGWFSIILWGLPLAAVALVGGTYAYTRSLHRTGATVGGSLAGAGLLGLAIGYGLPGTVESAAESAVDAGSEMESTVLDAVIALVNTFFSTVATQSLLLTVAGFGLVGVVYADTNGYFDSIKGDDGPDHQTGYNEQGAYQQQYEDGYEQEQYQGGYAQQSEQRTQHHDQAGQYQEGQTGQYQEGGHQQGQYQETQRNQYQQTGYEQETYQQDQQEPASHQQEGYGQQPPAETQVDDTAAEGVVTDAEPQPENGTVEEDAPVAEDETANEPESDTETTDDSVDSDEHESGDETPQ